MMLTVIAHTLILTRALISACNLFMLTQLQVAVVKQMSVLIYQTVKYVSESCANQMAIAAAKH